MLKLLNINNFTSNLKEVKSSDLFSFGDEYHQDGLLSELIFGPIDTPERKSTYAFINLGTQIIHPSAYRIITQLDRKIEKFISTESTFILTDDGMLEEDPNGITGLSKFIEIFPDIKFRTESETREKYLKFLEDVYKNGSLFINKLPVIPPEFRPVYKDESGNWMIDALNEKYQSIIRKSKQVFTSKGSGVLFELLSYGLQIAILDHDEYIRNKIGKKSGIVRNFMLGKRIDFSGRAAITPGPTLDLNQVGVPFRMAVIIFEPFIINKLLYTNQDIKNLLSDELKKFMNLDLSIESIKFIFKSIKNDDYIPEKLYELIWNATEAAMKSKVVLLKRDPVLHAESIRGMNPVLIKGNTIQLCPIQTGGFGADFDGDTFIGNINMLVDNELKNYDIRDIEKTGLFKYKSSKVKDGIKTIKFEPVQKNLKINSIDISSGKVSYKNITELSRHENIDFYKIEDKKNRFKSFWSSYDHSLIIYNEETKNIEKISPIKLIENPKGKYLIKQKTS